jgi:sugar lactone lactonase YvrE
VLVADSASARVWSIDAGGKATVWFEHELLSPRPYIGRFPGPNGIQVWNGAVYVAPSDRGHIVRIPVGPDGAAGRPEVAIPAIGADDFAIAADGTFFITTHPFDKVVKVAPDGLRTEIAGPPEGVVGPTAAGLAITAGGKRTLYVVTDGGLYRMPESPPLAPPVPTPAVIALELD